MDHPLSCSRSSSSWWCSCHGGCGGVPIRGAPRVASCAARAPLRHQEHHHRQRKRLRGLPIIALRPLPQAIACLEHAAVLHALRSHHPAGRDVGVPCAHLPRYRWASARDQALLRGHHHADQALGLRLRSGEVDARGRTQADALLTVASGAHQAYVRVLKGLDMIMAVAPRFPDASSSVGAREGSLPDKPANVIEVPFVPHHEIAALYGSATYYLQLSVSEGFGNALCEAMLCGCVPIVSDTGAMPRIIGDTGVVVKRRAPMRWKQPFAPLSTLPLGAIPEPRVNGSVCSSPIACGPPVYLRSSWIR
ncbi:MAG: glycosyltransferase [Flavobacteriales bacterium]|nr:glycosyltransferase [Flavobacteriales bacterium]